MLLFQVRHQQPQIIRGCFHPAAGHLTGQQHQRPGMPVHRLHQIADLLRRLPAVVAGRHPAVQLHHLPHQLDRIGTVQRTQLPHPTRTIKRRRQQLPGGEDQPGPRIRLHQTPTQLENIGGRIRGIPRNRRDGRPAEFGQHTFTVIDHHHGGLIGQRPLHRLKRLVKIRVFGDAVVRPDQLPAQRVQHRLGIAIVF
jgi:hypothetical protein